MQGYRPRVVDADLRGRLSAIGAVLIEGPKACGKTRTASELARTVICLDEDAAARALMALDPDELFSGPTPILFDEWQVEPEICNRVRRQVDDRGVPGQFILTGSATPRDDVTRHSGAGRVGVLRMRPMSLFESGHSSGVVSLAALLRGESQRGKPVGLGYRGLLERVVIGGWPSLLEADEFAAREWLGDYLDNLVHVDVPALGPRRNPRALARLLTSLGRSTGQAVPLTQLAADVGGEPGPVAHETITGYVDALSRLHVVDDSEAWRPHMRSRTRLRATPVRYLVYPSLGLAALGVGTQDLVADPNAAGFHFEGLVVRDLRIYAQTLRGIVDSWRDANGNEVDAVVTTRDGTWAAFEVKINPRAVDQAAAGLLRFASTVDTDRHGEPAALGVITGSGHAGRRPDGVHVIPITALGP